jgi:Rrf2 family protein
LLTLLSLARSERDAYLSEAAIAKEQNIPLDLLQQVLTALKREEYVERAKGSRGGYCLAKTANTVSLAEIVRLFDGALVPTESVSKYFYESTPVECEEKLLEVFRNIRDYIARKMEKTMLADVC